MRAPHRHRHHLRRHPRHTAIIAYVVLAACGGDGAPPQPDGRAGADVSAAVSPTASGLRLVNTGSSPLAFAVFEREFATRSLFAPCVDPGPACVRLPAGQSVVVPLDEIAGYTPRAREAVVYTWRVVRESAGGYRSGDFTSHVVRLPSP